MTRTGENENVSTQQVRYVRLLSKYAEGQYSRENWTVMK